MSVFSEVRDGVVIITPRIRDTFDSIEMGHVEERIYAELGKGLQRFIIDLENVNWLSSSGIAILIHMQRVVEKSSLSRGNGKMVLCNVTHMVRSTLVIARLTSVFETYGTVDDAITALTHPPAPSAA